MLCAVKAHALPRKLVTASYDFPLTEVFECMYSIYVCEYVSTSSEGVYQ